MPYRFVDDLTSADVAFEARGTSLEELFSSAWQATLRVMIENPAALAEVESREIVLEQASLDLLLYNFLQELIYYKDAESLLLRIDDCRIRSRGVSAGASEGSTRIEALARGQIVDPGVHRLGTDVKAVTFYNFSLHRDHLGWRATVVLDV
jgi:SHS2 domain-containing protein